MYCNHCGKTIQNDANLCAYCGAAIVPVPQDRSRLVRPRSGRKIAGVCMGLANYFDLDPTLIRVIWLICLLCGGVGGGIYIIAWIVIPEEPLYLPASVASADRTLRS